MKNSKFAGFKIAMKIFRFIHTLIPVITIAVMMVTTSCNSTGRGSGHLSTDLIQNPNSAEGINRDTKMPAFQFEKDVHDFGRIIQGEQVSFGFKFKNSGNAVLLISSVSSSCGCTIASYPDKPLQPGEEGVVTIRFDSRGRRGMQIKTVTLLANTQPNTKQLTVQANIITPETME